MPPSLRILWIKTGPLLPLDSGGKLRTYHTLKWLKQRHRVTYMTLVPESAHPDWKWHAANYCDEVIGIPWKERERGSSDFWKELAANALFSDLPYAVEKYRSEEMRSRILCLDDEYDLVVCDFLVSTINLTGVSIPAILFQHNVESKIWERHCSESSAIRKLFMYLQWKRMLRYENEACRRVGGVIAVSAEDARIFRKDMKLGNVLGDVPTGVDTDYFTPREKVLRMPRHIVYCGSMDWMPNEDAVLYFTREIYPIIQKLSPGVRFTVVGRNPSRRILQLAEADRSITVTGTVADVRPYLESALVMVVPLRIGGGTRIKIFEGMAMGTPVVSTAIGAEGLPLLHGRDILIADDPQQFARETADLIGNPARREQIASYAQSLVREKFNWNSAARAFERLCLQYLEMSRRTREAKMKSVSEEMPE